MKDKKQIKEEKARFSGICAGCSLMTADCHGCTQIRSAPNAFVEPFGPETGGKPVR